MPMARRTYQKRDSYEELFRAYRPWLIWQWVQTRCHRLTASGSEAETDSLEASP